MQSLSFACAVGAALLSGAALAQEVTVYRCVDAQGAISLGDQPCADAAATPMAPPAVVPNPVRKERFVLPPSEAGQRTWKYQPSHRPPTPTDEATLRAARLNLDLREKVATAGR